MRQANDTDTGTYVIVGALIAVLTAVLLILSGIMPPYTDRTGAETTVSTPHAALTQPYRSFG